MDPHEALGCAFICIVFTTAARVVNNHDQVGVSYELSRGPQVLGNIPGSPTTPQNPCNEDDNTI